jgi:GT2 family glycosyltransferase
VIVNKVSVIIVNWNGSSFLKDCISSLATQSIPPFEVIVIDNASTDGSTKQISAAFPWIKINVNQTNVGFAAANNQGIKLSQGDKILFLNMDTKLSPEFIGELSKELDATPGLGSVCGKLLLLRDGEQNLIDSVGIKISPERYIIELGQGQRDKGQYLLPVDRFGGTGAAVMYKRQALEDAAVDGQIFDESFFAYNEDVDLAWRCQLFGWRCRYVPQALGWHYRGGINAVASNWLRRRIRLNYYSMLYKNETNFSKLSLYFWRLRLHEEFVNRDPRVWLEFMKRHGELKIKRNLIQSKRRVAPDYISNLMVG